MWSRRLEAEKAAQQQREAAEQRNQPDFGSIPLGAVTKDGVWLGDMGGQGLRGPSTPFRKTKDAAPVPAKNAVPDELLNKESQLQSRHVNPNAPSVAHTTATARSYIYIIQTGRLPRIPHSRWHAAAWQRSILVKLRGPNTIYIYIYMP